jgi:hypothetical protein
MRRLLRPGCGARGVISRRSALVLQNASAGLHQCFTADRESWFQRPGGLGEARRAMFTASTVTTSDLSASPPSRSRSPTQQGPHTPTSDRRWARRSLRHILSTTASPAGRRRSAPQITATPTRWNTPGDLPIRHHRLPASSQTGPFITGDAASNAPRPSLDELRQQRRRHADCGHSGVCRRVNDQSPLPSVPHSWHK